MVLWILPAISAVANLFGAASKGQGQERTNQNDWISRNNQAQSNLFNTQQGAASGALNAEEAGKLNRAGLDLSRRSFALTAPNVRARQAAMGSIMENWRPYNISGAPPQVQARMGRISGGPQLGDTARQFGALMARQALLQQMEGDKFKDVPSTNFQSGRLTPPTLQGYKEPGFLEQLLGWLGLGGSAVGAMGNRWQGNPGGEPPMGAG